MVIWFLFICALLPWFIYLFIFFHISFPTILSVFDTPNISDFSIPYILSFFIILLSFKSIIPLFPLSSFHFLSFIFLRCYFLPPPHFPFVWSIAGFSIKGIYPFLPSCIFSFYNLLCLKSNLSFFLSLISFFLFFFLSFFLCSTSTTLSCLVPFSSSLVQFLFQFTNFSSAVRPNQFSIRSTSVIWLRSNSCHNLCPSCIGPFKCPNRRTSPVQVLTNERPVSSYLARMHGQYGLFILYRQAIIIMSVLISRIYIYIYIYIYIIKSYG